MSGRIYEVYQSQCSGDGRSVLLHTGRYFFIAKGLGSDGLAALNIAIPAYSFMHGCGMMLGMGGTTKYSIFRGQKMEKEGSRIFTNTVYLVGIFALIFVLLGLAMTAMLTGSFSNIILDYIFIFPMGMGMFGAAFATGLSPVISIGVLSRHWIARKNNFHFYPEKPDLRLTGTTFSLGIPSLISELASGIVIIVFNFIILGIRGNLGVAAYGVVTNISLVVTSIFTGIAQGMQPIASRSYGKGDAESTRQILRYAIVTLLGTAAVIYGMVFFLASPITAVFNSENDLQLQKIAEEGLRLYFLAAPFVGFNIVSAMFFTSTEQALPAQIISLLRGLFVIIPAAFIMSAVFEMWGVWLSYPVTEGIVTVFAVIVLIKNRKRYGAAA